MGKNSKASSGADAAGNLLYFSPEKLTLVMDTKHPLYDERVHLPVPESRVLNVMRYGIVQPIIVRNNGRDDKDQPIIEVVAGRQRVKWCLEANKRLIAEGKEPHRVPATMKRAEQGALMGVMIVENELRDADTPLHRARKLQSYLDTGKTEDEAAITFGCTLQTIKNLIKVLELHPKVQKWIEEGGPVNVAKELSAVPQEQQPEALEKLIASGNIKGARAVEAARNVRKGNGATTTKARMMSKVVLADWRKALKADGSKAAEMAYDVISRILGNERALANHPHLRAALDKAQGGDGK